MVATLRTTRSGRMVLARISGRATARYYGARR